MTPHLLAPAPSSGTVAPQGRLPGRTFLAPLTAALLLLGSTACENVVAPDDTDADTDADADADIELAYDDGIAEIASTPCGSKGDGAFGVHFTPPGPVLLVSVAYFIWDLGFPTTPFDVEVWDWDAASGLPGSDLLYTAEATPTSPSGGWFPVDLSSEAIAPAGDFVVAIEFTTPPGKTCDRSLFIGWDASDPDGRSFGRWEWGEWESVLDFFNHGEADFMIRATVRSSP